MANFELRAEKKTVLTHSDRTVNILKKLCAKKKKVP